MYNIIKDVTYSECRELHSEYIKTTNSSRGIITFYPTKELECFSDDGDVVVIYDQYTGKPLIIIERVILDCYDSYEYYKERVCSCCDVGYSKSISKSECGKYADITFMREETYDILVKEIEE